MSSTLASSGFDFSTYFTFDERKPVKRIADNYYVAAGIEGEWRDSPQSEIKVLIEKINQGLPWRQVVSSYTQEKNYPWLEKIVLSPARFLFLDLFDFTNVNAVLDFGSGWGQLSRPLARKAPIVLSVEPNPERLAINEAISRQEGYSNICFLQSNEANLPVSKQSFDLILLCGVYEWLAVEGAGEVREVQQQALKTLAELLTPQGKIIIAIENRLGLKYILGENDDHSGVAHISCLEHQEARNLYRKQYGKELRSATYDIKEYQNNLVAVGLSDIEFYLAYPDYKIPQVILPTDNEVISYFLKHADLPIEHDGTNGAVAKSAAVLNPLYRAMNNLDLAQYFAPSFIIQASK